MDCKIRFYDALQECPESKKLTLEEKLILTKSNPLIHCEFQFSDRFLGISFSSTLRDGTKGCRFKQIDYTVHPERWCTMIVSMTDEQENQAYDRAQEIDGCQYDLIGLASFAFDFIKQDPNKYWCSEACAELIKAAFGYDDNFVPYRFTPVGLFFEMYYRLNK